jgi:peptidoglycan hydrolase-like protein with peptidoglycan-binding domain
VLIRLAIAAAFLLVLAARPGMAQQGVWIQIEAQPTLRAATERARSYAARLGDVSGFAKTTGWYAIALGPYPRAEAERRLADMRLDRIIPADSYINTGANFRQRFWPVGGAAQAPGGPSLAALAPYLAAEESGADSAVTSALTPREETPAEARRAEAALDQAAREEIQAALRWKGFYQGAIDGAFGPGTRSAMADWQAANGFERSGVLTTAQRRALFDAYEQDLSALGLTTLRDETAGIEMQIPGALVEFAGYEPPFARFAAADDSAVELLLISQEGSPARLAAMYEALQGLEIIPREGARQLTARGFTLNGRDAARGAYAEAELADGLIKGFVLSWPRRDDGRFARVLPIMRASFRTTGGVLPPTAGGPALSQGRDLLAGLDLRRPDRIRSGVFVTPGGALLTSAEAVAGCGRITVFDDAEMELAFSDADLGLAALRPRAQLAPLGYARFRAAPPQIDSEIAVAGYAYGDALRMPVLSFGRLADLRGLDGREDRHRLSVAVAPGDAGGPVLDPGGTVLGVLLARADDAGRVLPAEVNFAAPADAIIAALTGAGVETERKTAAAPLPPEDLTRLAADMTAMVSCWN